MGGGGGGGGGVWDRAAPARLFFSFSKPVPFKKLNGVEQGGLVGMGKFPNSPLLHSIFGLILNFLNLFFIFIILKNILIIIIIYIKV